jgi:ribosomal protein S27AE
MKAWRAKRRAAGLPVSGSKTWDPTKRETWLAANKTALNAKAAERMRRYAKDPSLRQKHEARWKVGRAVASGRLVRQPCRCGSTRTQAHHNDYSKPLEVEWLCAPCHRTEHAKARGK